MKVQKAIVVIVTPGSASALASHFKVLRHNILCYGQGTVRPAILYEDRSFFQSSFCPCMADSS